MVLNVYIHTFTEYFKVYLFEINNKIIFFHNIFETSVDA